MKKKLICFVALLAAFAFSGCGFVVNLGPQNSNSDTYDSSETLSDSSEDESDASADDSEQSSDNVENSDSADSGFNGEDSSDDGNVGGDEVTADFTVSEKALFNGYFGFVIPFVASDEYYVEEYTYSYEEEGVTEVGVNYYAYGLTSAQFTAYKALFTTANGYTSDGTDVDSYGDMWYYYSKNDHYVDISYYADDEGDYVLDVYVYDLYEDEDNGNGGGNTGGDIGGGVENSNVITNAGKGLPTGVNGVYNVTFTKAKYVKNVTEQGYYIDGCPTVTKDGKNPAVLVIPVEFSDVTARAKGYTVSAINDAFNGKSGATDYYSVSEYYSISSYGKLNVEFTVLDEWFKPKNTSSYYAKQTTTISGSKIFIGDQMIMDEALAYLAKTMDLSAFDSDGNNMIDAVVMINTLDINGNVDFQWAYRYWNYYTDSRGYYYEYDGVSANDYMWASYQFLYESYDADGDTYYDKNAMNTYTYIHEFGHILGSDDYYDTEGENSPLGGCDVMDAMLGDHNAFTKFNYGWLTTSRLVTAEKSVTLTLEDFSKNGDTIIIANNWDDTLGAYQEYYIVVYYTNNGLNSGENAGYFMRDGIVVYHVNASLYKDEYNGVTCYDIYNNNTSAGGLDGYGTVDNLIEYVTSAEGNYTYAAGDSLSSSIKDDQGNKISYIFTVDSLTQDSATLTFVKN